MKKGIILLGVLIFILSVSAFPFTQKINFQGRLTNPDGTPVTSSESVTFTLYDDPIIDSVKGSQGPISITPDKNGVFSVLLNFDSSSFDGGDRWLAVSVAGETLLPRQQIAVVPYAYRAITAESLSGGASGLYVLKTGDIMSGDLNMNGKATVEASTGNIKTVGVISESGTLLSSRYVGIPAGSAQGDILIRDASSWTRLAAGTSGQYLQTQGTSADPVWATVPGGLSGSGTANYIPKFTAGTTLGNSIISDDGSTATIGGNLTVSGTGAFGGAALDANTGVIGNMGKDSAGIMTGVLGYGTSANVDSTAYGVKGIANQGLKGCYGVYGESKGVTGTPLGASYGVYGIAKIDGGSGTCYSIYGDTPSGGTTGNYAGYFAGDTKVTGNFYLPATTATTGIIKSGANRFIHNYGTKNTFVGVNAGNLAIAGEGNSAMGYGVLTSNTAGNCNSAIGVDALSSNTTGSDNSAMGINALTSNTSGNWNSAVGVSALCYNTEGSENSAMGTNALNRNTTGDENSAMGVDALSSNTTGSYNVALGCGAGEGVYPASNISNNVLLGYNAGSALRTNGNNNILIGYQAGNNITTGASNIIIGCDIDAPSATSANTLNIGNLIFATGVNGTGTTLSTGNVGIGTTAPGANKLKVQGTIEVTGDIKMGGVIGGVVPKGGVIMWSGSSAGNFDGTGKGLVGGTLEGWALCNGNNGTPNLIDRFIMGTSEAVPAATGGAATHSHLMGNAVVRFGPNLGNTWTQNEVTITSDTHALNIGMAGASYRAVMTYDDASWMRPRLQLQNESTYQADSRPSFYSLAFIMKL